MWIRAVHKYTGRVLEFQILCLHSPDVHARRALLYFDAAMLL